MSWDRPATVAGFATSAPNLVLVEYTKRVAARVGGPMVVDIGCGAGRNAIPLARLGARVVGIDLSAPMLQAASRREDAVDSRDRLSWVRGAADRLPLRSAVADLVVAHGVWNLARSGDEFRRALREGARVARPGGALFVFTFSRNTLPEPARPVVGETFVFTQFSGEPQCFLTESQLVEELELAGFEREGAEPLTEYNRPAGRVVAATGPVIYEGTFRRRP